MMNFCQQKGLAYAINVRDAPWPLRVYFRENDTTCRYYHYCTNPALRFCGPVITQVKWNLSP